MTAPPTVQRLLATARQRLATAGIAGAAMEARVLLEAASGWSRAELLRRLHDPLPDPAIAVFEGLIARRATREPIAHLLGRREFWSLPFAVGPAVLVPRPESEHVIEAALACVPDRERRLRLLDVGVGSGCLLLTLLRELPRALGFGTDSSAAALAIARANAVALGVEGRTKLIAGALAAGCVGPFDLVVSNPPYVATGDLATLEPELAFEPREALDGGADGLDVYRALLPLLPGLLAPGGVAVLEHGRGQGPAIAALADGFAVERRADLAGIDRVLVLRRVSAGAGA